MINFFILNKKFKINKKKKLKKIIYYISLKEKKHIYNINYIFCNNKYILYLNNKYLKKNKFTDTISFNYSNDNNIIYGDIFISIDQVYYNSIIYKVNFNKEMNYNIIHSLLHLIGYNDNNKLNYNKMFSILKNIYIKKFKKKKKIKYEYKI
ncbi:MAG: rRNA maturation RNase YbeY [Candidatus Shikimatogenerans bostrichidophilus]|nr:MAG: rRNA maturation RNase YbeY [Candidatus Shikimatogenerans bostrichidophilus]